MPLCICTSGRTRLRTLIVCLKLLCLDTSQYEIAQTKIVSKHENLISWLPHRPDFHFGTQASFSSNLCMPNLKECFGLCSYCQNAKPYVRNDKNKFTKYVFTSIFSSRFYLDLHYYDGNRCSLLYIQYSINTHDRQQKKKKRIAKPPDIKIRLDITNKFLP